MAQQGQVLTQDARAFGRGSCIAAILNVKRPRFRTGVVVDLWGLHEPLPGVGYQRVEPYPLRACPMACVLAIFTAASRGEADINPVGGPVTMPGIAGRTAGEASGVDKGLGQEGVDAVGGRPIGGDRA